MYSWIFRLSKMNGLSIQDFDVAYLGEISERLKYDVKRKYVYLYENMYVKPDIITLFFDTNLFLFDAMFMSEGCQSKLVSNTFWEKNKINTLMRSEIKNISICPMCLKDDVKQYGEAYLHRGHQLSGVQTCYKHHCLLHVYNGKKGHACDLKMEDYKEIDTVRNMESNNAYTDYTYTLLQSNIHTNINIIKNIVSDIVKERGYKEFINNIENWKYRDIIDYNVEKILKKKSVTNKIAPNEMVPLLMFLYPDVKKLISVVKEKSTGFVSMCEYKCMECSETYISTPFSEKIGFGCPYCNGKKSEQEIIKNIFEKKGYELKSEFESPNRDVLVMHRSCGRCINIKTRNFIYKNAGCVCEFQTTFEKAKHQIEETNEFELLKYTKVAGKCRIHAKACNHTFDVRFEKFVKLPRCRICYPKRVTTESLANKINIETNGEYKLIGEYDRNTKIKVLHRKCGRISEYTRQKFYMGKRCPICNKSCADIKWDEMYQLLCNYKAEYGNVNVPRGYVYRGKELNVWCNRQRTRYNNGKMKEQQYEKLKELGFSFDPLEDEWNRRFEQYRRYIKEKSGNTFISTNSYFEGEKLDEWMETQRKMYKAGKLHPEHLKKLKEVGFSFNPLEDEWNRRFEQYKRYVKEHSGNIYVPAQAYFEGEHLGRWVFGQRAAYKAGKLHPEHLKKLKEVGFPFNPLEDEWNRHFEQYKRYIKENNGNSYISKKIDYEGDHLGAWVHRQQDLYRAGKLSQERYEKLRSLGVIFEVLETDEWNRHFEQYKRYIKENGNNLNIRYDTDYEGEHLGHWVSYQRTLYRKGALSQERCEKLRSIGFSFDPLGDEWNRHYEQYRCYIKANGGNVRITVETVFEGERLGIWVHKQQAMYKSGKLSQERYEKLKKLGMKFE